MGQRFNCWRGGGALYLGQAATRCGYPVAFGSTFREAMSLSGHFARTNMAGLQLVLTNSSTNTTVEVADGADTSVTASVEYPIGTTPSRVTFGGSNTGTIPSGALLVSDWCSKFIPKGALFRVRIWRANSVGLSSGTPSSGHSFANYGDSYARSTMTQADETGTTTVPSDNSGTHYAPCAILTYMREPSVAMLGDSRVAGTGDVDNGAGAIGLAARASSPHLGWTSLAMGGTTASNFITAHANRAAIAQYCSHVLVGYPINDISGSASLATVQSRMQTIYGYFPNQTIVQMTCEPSASSASTNWTSDGDQTAAAYSSVVTGFNDWVKALPAPVRRCFDTAAAVQSPTDRTKWASDGTNDKYTTDGVHATQFGYLQVAASQAIDLRAFRR